MADPSIRYAERRDVGNISIENVLWFWDDAVDIFQNCVIVGDEVRANIRFSKEDAVKYAKMIVERYGEGK